MRQEHNNTTHICDLGYYDPTICDYRCSKCGAASIIASDYMRIRKQALDSQESDVSPHNVDKVGSDVSQVPKHGEIESEG